MSILETPEQRQIDELDKEYTKKLLELMQLTDFETICLKNGIKPLKVNKKEKNVAGKYSQYLEGKISISSILEYAKQQRMDVFDINKEYEKRKDEVRQQFEDGYYPQEENEFESFLKAVSARFSPIKCSTDEELKLQLAQFIKMEYPSKTIEINKDTTEGRISMLIDSEYGLLPVIADSREKLRSIIGEIEDYTKVCTESAVIAFDVGNLQSAEIEEYAKEVAVIGAYFAVINQYVLNKKGNI